MLGRLGCLWLVGVVIYWSGAVAPVRAQAPVTLELVTESGFPGEGQPRWLESLKKLGFTSVRMRSARADDEPRIVNTGTDDSPRFAVTGVLTRDNRLHLPGLDVRQGELQKLTDWLNRLRAGGEDVVTGLSGAFGLSAKQFVVLHDAVKPPITGETQGKSVRDVVRRIVDSLPIAVEIDASAEPVLAGGEQVPDDLQGLSRGTALAAALRPLGLIVVVTGQGKRAGGLRITKSTGKEEAWPVGIPPTVPPIEVAPTLLKFVNVEINERPLSEALEALQKRIQMPLLLDHNALAKHGIDLETKVSFPSKKTFYKKIIDELLHQALLRSELRVDDADQPFLWITTIKK